jgi:hypothetical protein
MRKNILITGIHRSGSTWIGKVMSVNLDMQYIHEPFNLWNNTQYRTPLKYWFEYVGNDLKRKEEFKKYIEYHYSGNIRALFHRIWKERSKYKKIILHEYSKYKKRENRKIIKDPIAIFSADFFYDYLKYDVLVCIRHPAAFVESIKSKNWTHDFAHFLMQEELMDDILYEFKKDIVELIGSEIRMNDIVEQAILLWNIIHFRIIQYKNSYKNWMFIKHEDVSNNPIDLFQRIFNRYNIDCNNEVSKYIKKTAYNSGVSGDFRDAKKNIKKWKDRLSNEEVSRIYEGTKDYWHHFYTEEDW